MILFALLFKSFVLLFNYQQPLLIFDQADLYHSEALQSDHTAREI